MRRALATAGTAAVVVSTLGAALVAPPSGAASAGYTVAYRAAAGSYNQAGGVSTGSTAVQTASKPAVVDKARTYEDSVVISAKDQSSKAVALRVLVTPANSATSTELLGCDTVGFTLKAGTTVAITPLTGRCPDGRLSTPGKGTITLTYHKLIPKPPAPRSASPAQRWAVLIGIQDYAGSTESTIGGQGDVDAIKRALIGSGWAASHIRVVTNAAATQAGIRAAIQWLASHSTPQTFSLLHYSGHVCIASRGPCASGHTYLWSYDNRFIPETEVANRMLAVKGYQWMDIAGCEAGAFNASGYAASSRMFTGSSRGSETSYEEKRWHQSVWTGMAWERGYNQGLAAPSGKVRQATIAQLVGYGMRQVPAYTSRQPAGAQHPVMAGGSSTWKLFAPPGG